MGKNGFFDPMGTYEDKYRPFSFRIPGNGTGQDYWRKIMTALSQAGYDGTISIEHEDNTMGQEEGIRKSFWLTKKNSGCPGDYEGSALANWITVSWPMDYAESYRWQWETQVLPFWKEFTAFAREHKVDRIALELHPGQCCFNPKTVKRLRKACGPEIGVNLDYSHLLWQRMDPILVIRELKGMIYHMHAKDIMFDEAMVRENGLINTAYFDEPGKRSWNFRTIGYGHGTEFWRNVFQS